MSPSRDELSRLLAAQDPVDGPALAADWDTHPASAALLDAILAEPALAEPALELAVAEPTVAGPALASLPEPARSRLSVQGPSDGPGTDDSGGGSVTSARGRRGRWGRPALLAAAAAVVVLALSVGGLPGSTPRVSAVRQLDDGRIVVDWKSTPLHGRALIEDLRDYGLDVQIAGEFNASPSMVGHVVAWPDFTDESDPTRQAPGFAYGGPDGTPGGFVWIIDPAVFDTTIKADLYVETPPGEDYNLSSSVFVPGEPLADAACSLTEPLDPARAADLARSLGMQVTWTVESPQLADGRDWVFWHSDEMPAGSVVGDQQLNAHSVDFTVRPPGNWSAAVTDQDRRYVSDLKADCLERP